MLLHPTLILFRGKRRERMGREGKSIKEEKISVWM